MVLPTGYHLLPKNEQYLRKLGYKGPSHQAKLHFCAKLGRGLYGLIQAARQWWKKIHHGVNQNRVYKRQSRPMSAILKKCKRHMYSNCIRR